MIFLSPMDKIKISEQLGVFYISQIGKYIPGGIWTIALSELVRKKLPISKKNLLSINFIYLYFLLLNGLQMELLILIIITDSLIFRILFLLIFFGTFFLNSQKFLNLFLRKNKIKTYKKFPTNQITFFNWLYFILNGLVFFILSQKLTLVDFDFSLANSIFIYAMSYLFGALAFFFPAGIGIRDATIIKLSAGSMNLQTALAATLLLRILTIIFDFFFAGAFKAFLFQKNKKFQVNINENS